MKLDIATLEAFLIAEKMLTLLIPKSARQDYLTIKECLNNLTREQAADLCRWLNGLSDAARVLRSLQFELPTESAPK